jgi:putative two-component system response regulator
VTPQPSMARIPPPRALVLCIDDDPLVLHFYEDLLPEHGYQTLKATDGLLGIQIAADACPGVILLDVMLRGLSGYDICRIARADPVLRDIPIILVTVLGDPSVATTGREAGATLTLQKPADPETIVTALQEVLGQRTDGPAR